MEHTEILDVLIASQSQCTTLLKASRFSACTVGFVNDNSIGRRGRNKSGAVGEPSPARIVVESYVRETITQRAEQEGKVSDKPAKSVTAVSRSEHRYTNGPPTAMSGQGPSYAGPKALRPGVEVPL